VEASGLAVLPVDQQSVVLARDLTDGGPTMLLELEDDWIVVLTDGEDSSHYSFTRRELEAFARNILTRLQQS